MELASLCRQYLPALLARHDRCLSAEQWSAFHALIGCRTGQHGELLLDCADCRHPATQPRSCGHRACNRCQQHSAQDWLARQQQKLLPVSYFLVTFTLPAELRLLARQHGRVVYDLLLQCAASTLQRFGRNAKAGQTELGMCAVLHTHTRRLDYHPHVHVVVPAGGVDRSKRLWRRLGNDYLFNGRALAAAFRGALLNALTTAGLPLPVTPRCEASTRLHENGGSSSATTPQIPERFVSYKKNQQSERSGLVQQQDMSRRARHILICYAQICHKLAEMSYMTYCALHEQ